MRIGVLGAGSLGAALAKRLPLAGHEVMLSYSRDPAKPAAMARTYGVLHGTPREAVDWADVVALAVTWPAVPDALDQAGDLDGKMLWDCTNAIKRDFSGLVIGTDTSGAETIRGLRPKARIVKGIPTFAELLLSDNPTVAGLPVSTFVAGDDAEAKAVVSELMAALPSVVTDVGGLEAARLIEPMMMMLVRLAYGQRFGPRIALNLVVDAL